MNMLTSFMTECQPTIIRPFQIPTLILKITTLQSILKHWKQGIALENYGTQRLQQALHEILLPYYGS